MADWKVFISPIEIFEHPNANKMSLAKVGSFQVVVGKGLYKNGDFVCFAPKNSILPPEVREYFRNTETGSSYLKGVNNDRVGSIRLRGELSEGAILPEEWWRNKVKNVMSLGINEDISKLLGITEYVPGPAGVPGKPHSVDGSMVQPVKEAVQMSRFVRHDVESFRIYAPEFVENEQVNVTEKLDGSQISIIKDKRGNVAVTSKGRAQKNLVLRKYPKRKLWHGKTFWQKVKNLFKKYSPEMNEYWRYAIASGLVDFVQQEMFAGMEIQIIGEVCNIQSEFTYGYKQGERPVKVFRVIINTEEQLYGSFPGLDWVPLLYQGPYILSKIMPYSEGMETVSGKNLHIREGVVLSPVILRKAKDGTPLLVKLINSKYRENDDEIS